MFSTLLLLAYFYLYLLYISQLLYQAAYVLSTQPSFILCLAGDLVSDLVFGDFSPVTFQKLILSSQVSVIGHHIH